MNAQQKTTLKLTALSMAVDARKDTSEDTVALAKEFYDFLKEDFEEEPDLASVTTLRPVN